MKRRATAFLASALFMAGVSPALAERLVSTLSSESVNISTSFSGETLSIFGNIEPDLGEGETHVSGLYHIVIAVRGPITDRVAREKTNRAGIWINTDQVVFRRVPAYFHVLASDALGTITDMVTLTRLGILPETQVGMSDEAGWYKSAVFSRHLVRLMTERGLYGIDEDAVEFLSGTAFTARVDLPSDIANGSFVAQLFVFKNGAVVARGSDSFAVRKSGFERFLGQSAVQQPVLYGIACIILALGTGWLGGVVFKR